MKIGKLKIKHLSHDGDTGLILAKVNDKGK